MKKKTSKLPLIWKLDGIIGGEKTTLDSILEFIWKEINAKKPAIDSKFMDSFEVEYSIVVKEK